jgi:hypothetical protein
VGLYVLLVSGTGKAIAVGCACLVSCLAFGYVCKGVWVVGNIYSANAVVCYIYIRITPAENVKMLYQNFNIFYFAEKK